MAEELAYGQNPDHDRPDWDDYFMEIMETVAKRANCDRGRSAAEPSPTHWSRPGDARRRWWP